MELGNNQASCIDPLLLCCMCKSTLQEPVQLQCLHSCCRRCLNNALEDDLFDKVTCPSCIRTTASSEAEPNTFLDFLVRGCLALADIKVCTICKVNGEAHASAAEWCASCRQSFCEECLLAHKRLNRNHCTQPIDELLSLEEVRTKVPSPQCSVHNRPLEVVCFSCEKAKCLICWEVCNNSKHEMGLMTEESFEAKLQNLKSEISSMEEKLLRSSVVFKKYKNLPSELKSSRESHLALIQQQKRLIVDALEDVVEEMEHSTKSMYDRVEVEAENAAAIATKLEDNFNFSRDYGHRLVGSNSHCDLWNQHKMLRSHLITLSAELDKLSLSMSECKSVCILPSLPENLECVLRSWIGQPRVCTAQSSHERPKVFCTSLGYVTSPYACCDVTLMKDGHVLLAAEGNGLLEFCSKGHKLSEWRPTNLPNYRSNDLVCAVTASGDGRVAVGLYHSQLVILLRKAVLNSPAKASNSQSQAWIEDCRLHQLQSPPRCMAVYGDNLAVAEWCVNEGKQILSLGRQLELMTLSREKLPAAVSRGYAIGSVALTASAVITSSSGKVVLNRGRNVCVIDAHNFNKVRIWRYELESNEVSSGIFSYTASHTLYVAIHESNGSSGRLAAINSEDGRTHERHVLSFDNLLLPERLSLDDSGTVVAALCKEAASKEKRTVTLHMFTHI